MLTDWVSRAVLALIASAVLINTARGTLPAWLRAKFLLDHPAPRPQISGGGNPGGDSNPGRDGDPGRGGNTAGGGSFSDPAPSARLISVWGDPRDGGARSHKGVDLAAPTGTQVLSIAPGTVARAGNGGKLCGLRVAVKHSGGWESIYCHLSAIAVSAGDEIDRAGVPLGAIGTTGNATGTTPHLHFELHRNGAAVDPQALIGR